jgi:hypothetical protein
LLSVTCAKLQQLDQASSSGKIYLELSPDGVLSQEVKELLTAIENLQPDNQLSKTEQTTVKSLPSKP